jgi:hypothetical protein
MHLEGIGPQTYYALEVTCCAVAPVRLDASTVQTRSPLPTVVHYNSLILEA